MRNNHDQCTHTDEIRSDLSRPQRCDADDKNSVKQSSARVE